MSRDNKTLLILAAIFLASALLVFFLTKNPAESEYTVVLSSDRKVTNSQPNAKPADTKQSSEQNIIIELLDSTASIYGKRELKDYSMIKEENGFKLVKLTIFSNTTKATYDSYAILRNGSVIAGVNSEKSIDSLKNAGVPAGLIDIYVRNRADV